jgi:hypothetical protein
MKYSSDHLPQRWATLLSLGAKPHSCGLGKWSEYQDGPPAVLKYFLRTGEMRSLTAVLRLK